MLKLNRETETEKEHFQRDSERKKERARPVLGKVSDKAENISVQ